MAGEIPLTDAGNDLLGEGPAQITTGLIDTPAGQRMVLTIRTATTTLSVLMGSADAKGWGALISKTAATMSGAGLVVAAGIPAVSGNGKAGHL